MYGWTPGCGGARVQQVAALEPDHPEGARELPQAAEEQEDHPEDPLGEAHGVPRVLGRSRPAGASSHRRGIAADSSHIRALSKNATAMA